ncbi:MAG: Panacea domain-containing protein [Salinispira sp.]
MNKILWFSDVTARDLLGKTISDYGTYLSQEFGPVLPSIIPEMNVLSQAGLISTQDFDVYDYRQRIFRLTEPTDLTKFEEIEKTMSEEHRAILDEWINHARDITAMELAEESHEYSWWKQIEADGRIGCAIKPEDALESDSTPPKIQTEIINTLKKIRTVYGG